MNNGRIRLSMIFFGSLFRSQLEHDEKSNLRALLHAVVERLCQRYKLTLSLAFCLCLGSSSVHASHPDISLEAHVPKLSIADKNDNAVSSDGIDNSHSTLPAIAPTNAQPIENVANINGLAPTTLWQPELKEPSLYALLDAEFAADCGDS